MVREVIYTDKAPKLLAPYSQAIRVGNFLFLAGQVGINPKNGKLEEGFEDQAKRTLENIKSILEQAGYSLKDVVNVNIFLAKKEDFGKMNKIYKVYFPEEPPARTTVVAHFPLEEILIEINVIAFKD
ncbi:MAG: Rid family detoxifying hydrolase [Nitrososphaerales archaeon]